MFDHKTIHFHVYNPAQSIFKSPANERAKSYVVHCSNSDNCPLFKRGECIARKILDSYCPYGYERVTSGPTKRAKGFSRWIQTEKTKYEGVPSISSPRFTKLEFIGEYVYLPYAHMDMNENIPILSKSQIFSSGKPFMKLEDWNISNIRKIIDFRPQALFDGEIRSYQFEVIPKFLEHLREKCFDLFAALVVECPQYVEKYKLEDRNFVGRKALLNSLTPPFQYTTEGSRKGEYKVIWDWNGKELTTFGKHAYNETWGEIKLYESVKTTIVPQSDTVITVRENGWVNENTVFVD